MKRGLIAIPLVVASLFAASCSKDKATDTTVAAAETEVAADTTAAAAETTAAAATETTVASAAETTAAAAASPSGDAVKAAWIYVGPTNDGGWTTAHDNGRPGHDDL